MLFAAALFSGRAAADSGRRALNDCEQSLWGCRPPHGEEAASGTVEQRYEHLLSAARGAAGTLRAGMSGDLEAAARLLTEATQLFPNAPEAYSLLGQIDLARGQLEPAETALHRAAELLLSSEAALSAAPLVGPPMLERLDPQLALALGLLAALEGDLPLALERYQRLLRIGTPTHRLLYRTADVLMALGRLDEATALFERACALPRGLDTPSIDIARGCDGYLVALDRGERVWPGAVLRRLRSLDRGMRALGANDFVPIWERDYLEALVLPPSPCQRREAFNRYLRGARDSKKNAPPLSYLRRAEVHLKELAALSCP